MLPTSLNWVEISVVNVFLSVHRWRPDWSVLRRTLGRWDFEVIRAGATLRLPGPRHHLPVGRLRFPLQDPDCYETRWDKDRQAGEADDPDRGFLRDVHSPSIGGASLPRLRTGLHGPLDAHLEHGDVRQARTTHCLLHPLPSRRTRQGPWPKAGVRAFHDQVSRCHGRRNHFLLLDMVGENTCLLEELLRQGSGAALGGVCMR